MFRCINFAGYKGTTRADERPMALDFESRSTMNPALRILCDRGHVLTPRPFLMLLSHGGV